MNFFTKFPTVSYTLTDENGVTRTKTTTNVLTRVVFRKIVDALNVSFVHYNVNDAERPDTVATKYYGSAKYTWVVLLANDIFHHNDWPKGESEFQNYITAVYGSISAAQTRIYGYKNANGRYIDETTYNTLSILERSEETYYDYEVAINDARRRIKLIPKSDLAVVLQQFDVLLNIQTDYN